MQGSCAELIVVDDGQQAVDAYRASRPDLMLLDVHMPNVSVLSFPVVPCDATQSTKDTSAA